MRFTPLHLEILLHYHYKLAPLLMKTQVWVDYRRDLQACGLIAENAEHADCYTTTDRGKAFIEAMCNLPLPTKHTEWRMPARATEA